MLRTVIHELNGRIPSASLAIDPGYGSYENRADYSLLQLFPSRLHVGQEGFSNRFLKQKIFCNPASKSILNRVLGVKLREYGCITLDDISGLVDISGFAYTDQWGTQPTLDLMKLTCFYRENGKSVVLLPQAFGPFQSKKTRLAFSKAFENASLVFARDAASYNYIADIVGESKKLLIAPDITLFYPNRSHQDTASVSSYVCIVPNVRMLDQGQKEWGSSYERILLKAIKTVIRRGKKIYIVIHDSTGQDLLLARSICRETGNNHVRVHEENCPLKLKKFLAGSYFVLGSRYHSLIAAFSQCVPSIALGWSHKYEMLYKEFASSSYMFPSQSDEKSILEKVDSLLDEETNLSFRKKVFPILSRLEKENQKMWGKVVEVFESDGRG
jgi:polysaccharide pyruvyl transferase WcaK-like protein